MFAAGAGKLGYTLKRKAANMIVENRTQFVIVSPIADIEIDGKKNYRRHFRFMPGNNEIDAKDWEQVREILSIQYYLEAGDFKELGGNSLTKRSDKEALALVSNTYDLELLSKWREDDLRDGVKKAINKQISKITLTPEEVKKAQGDLWRSRGQM